MASPRAVAVSAAGEVFVAAMSAGQVVRVDPMTGAIDVVAEGDPLVSPSGLAF